MSKEKLKKHAEEQQARKDRIRFIQFAGIFLGVVVLYYLISSASWFTTFTYPLLVVYAKCSSVLLNVMGYGTSVHGAVLSGANAALEIKEGCDAIAPAVLYSAAVLAFPLAWRARIKGIWQGLLLIFTLNIIRIVSLYLVYVHAKKWFDFMHVDFWQSVFVVLTLVLFLFYIRRYKDLKS